MINLIEAPDRLLFVLTPTQAKRMGHQCGVEGIDYIIAKQMPVNVAPSYLKHLTHARQRT